MNQNFFCLKIISLNQSHKKWKDSLEKPDMLLIFHINLKYLGWQYRAYIKTAKNGDFCQEFLNKSDFEAVLATFCCCNHGAKASEAVHKIATDQKEYRKCFLCVIICSIAQIHLSLNDSEKWLVTRIPSTQLKSC